MVLIIQIEMIAMEPAWHEGSEGKKYLIDTEEKVGISSRHNRKDTANIYMFYSTIGTRPGTNVLVMMPN